MIFPEVALKSEISPSTDTAVSEVTSPEPEGVDHVPSPRQKVVDEADVPLPRLVTGRLPVTPVASDTLVIVFDAPLIVLFVNVCVFVVPTTAHVAPCAAVAAMWLSIWACVLVPAPDKFWCVMLASFTVRSTLSPCVASFDHTAIVSRLLAERNFIVSLQVAPAEVVQSVMLA